MSWQGDHRPRFHEEGPFSQDATYPTDDGHQWQGQQGQQGQSRGTPPHAQQSQGHDAPTRTGRMLTGVAATALILLAGAIAIGPAHLFVRAATGGTVGTPPTNGPSTAATGCGVSKTAAGYAFSWLHVQNGNIEDDQNWVVHLQGFNRAATEFGDAPGGGLTKRVVDWYSQQFPMNLWRIAVNVSWWNSNANVPHEHLSYRQWIGQVVQWAEADGSYVELDAGPLFHAPPCGGTITYCPPQNAGAATGDPTQQTTGSQIAETLTFWSQVARQYANDPAVLYDDWNEMHDIGWQTWHTSQDQLMSAIQQSNPRALIFFGGPNWNNGVTGLVDGQVPPFQHPNLVVDYHAYPTSGVYKTWTTRLPQQISWLKQHNYAIDIGEWGGSTDSNPYHSAIVALAAQDNVALTFYESHNVESHLQINSIGQLVQASYLMLSKGSVVPSPTPIPSSSPSSSPGGATATPSTGGGEVPIHGVPCTVTINGAPVPGTCTGVFQPGG